MATRTATLPVTGLHRSRARRHRDALDFPVVARDCALLPAAQPRGRRRRVAAALLAGDRLGLRHLVPLQRRGRPALSRLLLPRRADHDRAVHRHLHHDVGDRRPQGRLPALGAGRARQPLGDRAGQGARRSHAGHAAGADLPRVRARCSAFTSPSSASR